MMNRQHRKGGIIPLAALILPILFLLSAITINLAYIQKVQTEVNISADVAARAAGRILSATGDEEVARRAANDVAAANRVAGKPVTFAASEIVFGQSTRRSTDDRYEFVPNLSPANAVVVYANRTSASSNGEVSTFLPNLLGRSSLAVSSSSISTRVEVDIALVLDRSGSMAYGDTEKAAYPPIPAAAADGWFFGDPIPPKSRWLDVVDAVKTFFNRVEGGSQAELVSLATYSDNGSFDVPLTIDYKTIISRLDQYSANFDGGHTNISEGLTKGSETLTSGNGGRPFAAKVIVLMTDGVRTAGSNPTSVAKSLAKNGITTYTVTFSKEADQKLMQKVAEEGGGQHFHADTREELLQVFDTIASFLPTLIVD